MLRAPHRRFWITLAICLLLALYPWPYLANTFVRAFCAAANLWPDTASLAVAFAPIETGSWLAALLLAPRVSRAPAIVSLDTHHLYLLFAVYVVLAANAPLWRPGRMRPLVLIGAPVVLMIAVFSIAIRVACTLSDLHVWAQSDVARAPLLAAHATLNALPVMPFALPTLVWLSVLFWPTDSSVTVKHEAGR